MTVSYWEIFLSCITLWVMWEFFKLLDEHKKMESKDE